MARAEWISFPWEKPLAWSLGTEHNFLQTMPCASKDPQRLGRIVGVKEQAHQENGLYGTKSHRGVWLTLGESTDSHRRHIFSHKTRQPPCRQPWIKCQLLEPSPLVFSMPTTTQLPSMDRNHPLEAGWDALDLHFGRLKRGVSSLSKEQKNSLPTAHLRTDLFCWK